MTMEKLALAAATIVACAAAAAATCAGETMQGPQLIGIALQSIQSNQPVVTTVTLRSGETVVLRPQATD